MMAPGSFPRQSDCLYFSSSGSLVKQKQLTLPKSQMRQKTQLPKIICRRGDVMLCDQQHGTSIYLSIAYDWFLLPFKTCMVEEGSEGRKSNRVSLCRRCDDERQVLISESVKKFKVICTTQLNWRSTSADLSARI